MSFIIDGRKIGDIVWQGIFHVLSEVQPASVVSNFYPYTLHLSFQNEWRNSILCKYGIALHTKGRQSHTKG